VVNGIVAIALLFPAVVAAAAAQVKITLPKQQYKLEEQIQAKVENAGTRPATFCVEFGQWSPKGGSVESTPSPFWVERNDDGKWHTLLIGPDLGSSRHAVELGAGNSLEFPLRLNDAGKMRLQFKYWLGSASELDCTAPHKDAKQARSTTFTVQ
jgi:hypothetical protein